jgi:hypothetical protein
VLHASQHEVAAETVYYVVPVKGAVQCKLWLHLAHATAQTAANRELRLPVAIYHGLLPERSWRIVV